MLNESLSGVGADWDLWLTLVWQGSGFTYHDELLFDYRVHPHSLVATRADTRTDVRRVLGRFTLDEIRGLYARRLFPDDVIEEAIASIAIAKGDYARALPYWQHRAAAGDVAGAAQAGALLVALGDEDAAEPLLRRVARPGEWPEAWNNLGVALARRGQHSEAQACFAEALRQLPLYRDARLNLESPSPSLVTERLLRPLDQILR
jgi:tetratricopeptide (TPR) repeat protein